MRLRCAALLATALGCSQTSAPTAEAGSPGANSTSVYVVNYPLSYFAQRMAPAGVRVTFPVPAGIDPAFWKPPSEAVRRYQDAGLIFLNGAGYAHWTRYATLPRARVVVTARACRDTLLPAEESVRHRHGPDGPHEHSGLAFTTWLDFELAACQARRVRDALVEKFPSHRDSISSQFERLEGDLQGLHERMRKVGKALGGQAVLASHPVYQYLGDAYGVSIQSLHLEPDQVLDDDDWKVVDAILQRHSAKWMLWEGAPLSDTEAGLLKRGVTVIVFDPAGQTPSQGDLLSVMSANADGLECAVGVKACP